MIKNFQMRGVILWFLNVVPLMLPISAMASSSAPFSGCNASVAVGVSVPDVSVDGSFVVDIPSILKVSLSADRNTTNACLQGGARLGYNKVCGQCYLLGVAGDVNFGCNDMKFNAMVEESGSSLNILLDSRMKLKNQYALLCKFGRLIGCRTLIYGLAGPQWGDFSLYANEDYSQNPGLPIETNISERKKICKGGVLLGLGSEVLINPCMSVALEYSHTYYGNITESGDAPVFLDGVIDPDAGSTFSVKSKIRVHNVMLRFGYYF